MGLKQSYMLKLTKKADYGLIAARHLACRLRLRLPRRSPTGTGFRCLCYRKYCKPWYVPACWCPSKERPAATGWPAIAHEISALEVIRSIDGPIILTQCFTEHDEPTECDQSEMCPVREPLRKVHEGILRLLSGITIADLASDDMSIPVIPSMVSSIQPLTRPISR